jgi:hypothetical protein
MLTPGAQSRTAALACGRRTRIAAAIAADMTVTWIRRAVGSGRSHDSAAQPVKYASGSNSEERTMRAAHEMLTYRLP